MHKKAARKKKKISTKRKRNPCAPCMAAMNPSKKYWRKNPYRKILEYGTLPTYEEYSLAFNEKFPDRLISLRRDKRLGNVDLNELQLWYEINFAINEYDKESLKFAYEILKSLGFEWESS